MREWQAGVARIAQGAIDAGELRSDADPKSIAAILISALEGAVMTSILLRDPRQMTSTAEHLREWVRGMRVAPRAKARR